MSAPRRPRGLFTEITEGVYWFLVLDVMLALSAAPTALLWLLLSPGPMRALLFVLAALPLLPALAAGLYACRTWRVEKELSPVRQFLRGYRLNAVDSLAVGAPLLAVLGLIAFNLTYTTALASGTGALRIALLALGALGLLVLVRALSIVSQFSFRVRDVYRLSAFTLLVKPLSTLALLSLGVLSLGVMLVIGEFMLLVVASLLVFALWASERPVTALLTEQFTASAESSTAESSQPESPEAESPEDVEDGAGAA